MTLDNKTDEKLWQDWNDSNIINQIDKISGYHKTTLINKHDLNAQGERCNGCTAEGVEFEIEFQLYRTEGKLNQTPKCNLSSSFCIVEKT